MLNFKNWLCGVKGISSAEFKLLDKDKQSALQEEYKTLLARCLDVEEEWFDAIYEQTCNR